jgi:ethanolaminephosphotransferase
LKKAVAAYLQVGTSYRFIAFYLQGAIAFGFATWEHYHTGSLQMGLINGPSDGEFMLYVSAFIAAYKGPGFFLKSFREIFGLTFPGALSELSDYPLFYTLIFVTGPGLVLTVFEK